MSPRLLTAACFLLLTLLSSVTNGQTTSFTYQGKLTDNNGVVLSGQYDFQFKLYDTTTVATGTQLGTTQTLTNLTVTNGVFTVPIDFGACDSCFNGAARFLEIAVRQNGGGAFTTLNPRQPISSTPYALKTLNLTFNGPYNNGTTIALAASNAFAGDGAGLNTAPNASISNSSGKLNSFYGAAAGKANTSGSINAFFGTQAGLSNTTASGNSFFGVQAGGSNITGNNNTAIGYGSDMSLNLTNATAIGYRARVTQNNSLVLGSILGVNFATDDTNVGIGVTAPLFKLHVVDRSNTGLRVQTNAAGGTVASFGGNGDFQVDAASASGGRFIVKEGGNVGIGTNNPQSKLHVSGGDVFIAQPNSLIITSPNGSCWQIRVSDAGALTAASVPCP
jgi:hypothetical protein